MKIALFVDQFPKVSETFILNQIDGLLEQGHDITIFPCQASGETRLHEVVERRRLLEKTRFPFDPAQALFGKARVRLRIMLLRLTRRKAISRMRRTFACYRRIGNWQSAFIRAEPLLGDGGTFDVLFAHFGPNGLRASWYRDAGLIDGPLVTVFHGFDLSSHLKQHDDGIYDPLFEKGDLFLPISRFWKDRLLALGCREQKTQVHHVGIDSDHFAYRSRSCGPNESVVLISVARLVEKKGIEYAIQALSLLAAAGKRIRYHIIGDGPLLESLRMRVAEEKLDDHVVFLGTKTCDEVADELNRAHIFLAPSVTSSSGDMEGIPTVLMEAMATGMPVISTLHSGIPELVEDGVSGRLVGERDAAALAGAIQALVDDSSRWPAMGQAGRQKVLEEFNIKTLNDKLEALFEQLPVTRDGV